MPYHTQTRSPEALLERMGKLPPPQRAEFENFVLETRRRRAGSSHIPKMGELVEFPLSQVQERVWAFENLFPGTGTYNISWTLMLRGALRLDLLERSLAVLVERHPILRSTFHATPSGPLHRVTREAEFRLEHWRAEAFGGNWEEAALEQRARWTGTTFDLERGPLFRAQLLHLAADFYWLIVGVHHLIFDGWSIQLVNRELSAIYRALLAGEAPPAGSSDLEFSDYVHWERDNAGLIERDNEYWVQEMQGAPAMLEVPTDYSRAASALSSLAWGSRVEVPKELVERLEQVCAQQQVSFFVLLLSAWALVLHRYGGGEEIVVGSPLAARQRPELQDVIGFFANTLPLRIPCSAAASFAELLQATHRKTMRALEHQSASFETIAQRVQVNRSYGLTPIFQNAFTYLEEESQTLQLPNVAVEQLYFPTRNSHFDLVLAVRHRPDAIYADLALRRSLFAQESCQRLVKAFEQMLAAVAEDATRPLAEYSLLSEDGRDSLRRQAAKQLRAVNHSVPAVFDAQVERTPDALAMVDDANHYTYRQLQEASERIAAQLLRLGVQPGQVVGVLCDKSVHMIEAFLGVLRAGAAYLPLDLEDPAVRRNALLADVDARFLICPPGKTAADLPRGIEPIGLPVGNPVGDVSFPTLSPDAAAYIMFTSGSTGKPKGVVVPHRGIVRLVRDTDYARFDSSLVFLHMAQPAFDASTVEIWGPLLNGGRCVVFGGRRASFAEIGESIRRHGVTTIFMTTSLFHAAIDEAPEIFAPLAQLLVGGEALSARHAEKALALLPRTQLLNCYGPTECTTFATCYAIPRDFNFSRSSVPLGPPIANTTAYVLDPQQRMMPPGAPGELCLGGPGVALGYWKRPELSSKVFLPDPYAPEPGHLLYRTGDLVRWDSEGNLEFLGRIDDQVKIRGFRVEPGEIESALLEQAGVAQAAVTPFTDSHGVKRLVAHLVLTEKSPKLLREIQDSLRSRLPAFMLPEDYVLLDRMPLRPNGKIDKAALPYEFAAKERGGKRRHPQNFAERELLELWREILQSAELSVDDDFFACGGNSLSAVRLMARVEKLFHKSLPVAALFAAPSPAAFARVLVAEGEPGWIAIQQGSSAISLVWIDSDSVLGPLSRELDPRFSFFDACLTAEDFSSMPPQKQLTDFAELLADRLERHLPNGSFVLASFCLRGFVALETARVLRARGREVSLVVLVDPSNPETIGELVHPLAPKALWRRIKYHCGRLRHMKLRQSLEALRIAGITLQHRAKHQMGHLVAEWQEHYLKNPITAVAARHKMKAYDGALLVLRCVPPEQLDEDEIVKSWRRLARGPFEMRAIAGDHVTLFEAPHVATVASAIRDQVWPQSFT